MGKNIFRDGRGVIDVHDTSWFRELLYDKWPRLFSLKQYSYELVIGNLLINGQDGSAPVETVPLNLRSARPQAIQQSNGHENRSTIISRHNAKKTFYINYKRHDNRRTKADIYNDRVSGSSKLYSVLRNYAVESDEIQKARIRAKLIESGLTTIMILDERVFNYVLRDRDMERVSGKTGLYNSYQRLNIVVPYKLCINGEVKYQAREESVESIDGYKRRILLLEKERSIDIYFKQPQNTIADVSGDQYNINSIVIHQTILDYMAKGLFPEDHLNTVGHHSGDKVIFKLKHESNIPCIIITSGRGRLHNSSRFAKFIPFANISDLLLRTDPDKYTLTQTLLQSLNLPDESKK